MISPSSSSFLRNKIDAQLCCCCRLNWCQHQQCTLQLSSGISYSLSLFSRLRSFCSAHSAASLAVGHEQRPSQPIVGCAPGTFFSPPSSTLSLSLARLRLFNTHTIIRCCSSNSKSDATWHSAKSKAEAVDGEWGIFYHDVY